AFTLHVARDAMGDITAIGNAPGASPATETYAYDPLYRLTQVSEADGSILASVAYDQAGDRLSKSGSGLATGTYDHSMGTHLLIATGNAARSVDANGNMTAMAQSGSAYGFGYNDRNRMTIAQLAGSTVGSYTYNALDQRIQKVANGTTERYDYNETHQMLGEYGATNRDYIWMDGLPVANVDRSGTISSIVYVTADQFGTPRAIADSNGNAIWQFAYAGNPWGETQPTSNGYVDNFRLPGQYYDQETGLANYGPRTYGADIGGFNQPDPTGQRGGYNLYVYASDNPLHFVDALGLQQTDELDPKTSEALNTPETNAEVKALDESQAEAARAQDAKPFLSRRPASEFGEFGQCSAVKPTTAQVGPQKGPNFIVTPSGTVYPVPEGAVGPTPTDNGRGMQFQGGSGGGGLNPRTSGFRYMEPVTSGPYQYPNGYGSYNNISGQAVNPYTGQTIAPSNPMWHIPNG
ncbi:RHS repeat-associated core domain-containing protein, partial [Dyella jejuensis]